MTTFLMFAGDAVGKAEEAVNSCVSLFDNLKILDLKRHDGSSGEIPEIILNAVFILNGQTFMCMDSNVPHPFTFNPAVSLYVRCYTEEKINKTFAEPEHGGTVLMELAEYPFTKKFVWVQDGFGISWQFDIVQYWS